MTFVSGFIVGMAFGGWITGLLVMWNARCERANAIRTFEKYADSHNDGVKSEDPADFWKKHEEDET